MGGLIKAISRGCRRTPRDLSSEIRRSTGRVFLQEMQDLSPLTASAPIAGTLGFRARREVESLNSTRAVGEALMCSDAILPFKFDPKVIECLPGCVDVKSATTTTHHNTFGNIAADPTNVAGSRAGVGPGFLTKNSIPSRGPERLLKQMSRANAEQASLLTGASLRLFP